MSPSKQQPRPGDDGYLPGMRLGLPTEGVGSTATWWARVAALVGDWAIAMVIAVSFFGTEVLTGKGWQSWMILTVFFVHKSVMTFFVGSSVCQLIAKVGVMRTNGDPIGWRAFPRTFLLCMVIPALVVDGDRRGLHDLLLGTTVVVRR